MEPGQPWSWPPHTTRPPPALPGKVTRRRDPLRAALTWPSAPLDGKRPEASGSNTVAPAFGVQVRLWKSLNSEAWIRFPSQAPRPASAVLSSRDQIIVR